MNMYIKNYDYDSKEADIVIENGSNKLMMYCPFLLKNKLPKKFVIEAFLPENFKLSNQNDSIIKEYGYYSYLLIGKIIYKSMNYVIVSVFDIEIKIDYVPFDVEIGELLSFEVKRLDFICL